MNHIHLLPIDRINTIVTAARDKCVAVVGDIMLDRYFWGNVSRISPEAPVPVVDIERETFHLGGASNVAMNLQSLGLQPLMIGVIGEDAAGSKVVETLRGSGMSERGIIRDAGRPTTVKTRIIGNNQQIARLDREVKVPVQDTLAKRLLAVLEEDSGNLAGIILEDYNKGVMTKVVIQDVVALAQHHAIPVFVDPKFANFFAYTNVTLFKPNKKETQDALGYTLASDEDILRAGKELLERLQCESVLITLGARGMMLAERGGRVSSVPTRARHVADVSGAGDTAIATLAAAVAGGATLVEAASLANSAAGAVCEEPGIVAISPQRLIEAVRAGE
jgi:rfaE bifunctional protein kinase chain/domain